MISSNISSTVESLNLQQYPAVHNVPSPSRGTNSNEDTVQLSDETQRSLTTTKASAPPSQPSIDQVIKEAADGDITAFAKLVLVA